MPVVTRLRHKYTDSISLYIPEEYNNETIEHLRKSYNSKFKDSDRYISINRLNTNRSSDVQFISEYITDMSEEFENYYPSSCVKITGNILDIYDLLNGITIYNILEETIIRYYQKLILNLKMTNNDYNKIIIRKKCTNTKNKIFCPLTYDYINKGQMIAITPCNHSFSSKQLREWLTKKCIQPLCPLCKKNLNEF